MTSFPPSSPITPGRSLHYYCSSEGDPFVESYFQDNQEHSLEAATAGRIGLQLIDELKSKNSLIEQLSSRLRHIYTNPSPGLASSSEISRPPSSNDVSSMFEQSVLERAEKEISKLDTLVAAQQKQIEQLLAANQAQADNMGKLSREIQEQAMMISMLRDRPESASIATQANLNGEESELLRRELVEQNKYFQKELRKIQKHYAHKPGHSISVQTYQEPEHVEVDEVFTPVVLDCGIQTDQKPVLDCVTQTEEKHAWDISCQTEKQHHYQTDSQTDHVVSHVSSTQTTTPHIYSIQSQTDSITQPPMLCLQSSEIFVAAESPIAINDGSTQFSGPITPITKRTDHDGDVMMMTVKRDDATWTGKLGLPRKEDELGLAHTDTITLHPGLDRATLELEQMRVKNQLLGDTLASIRNKAMLVDSLSERMSLLLAAGG